MLSYRWNACTMCHVSRMLFTSFRSFSILNVDRRCDRSKLTAELNKLIIWGNLIHLLVAILLLLSSVILVAWKEHGFIIYLLLSLSNLWWIQLLINDRVRRDDVKGACEQTLMLLLNLIIIFIRFILFWVVSLRAAWCFDFLWADGAFVTLSRL